jgi:chromosomal replication initiation ATPase DnaA
MELVGRSVGQSASQSVETSLKKNEVDEFKNQFRKCLLLFISKIVNHLSTFQDS